MNEQQNNRVSAYFKCDHCSQEFSLESFRIAAYLYGIIFLVGQRYGYIGIVCPNCINTTLRKVKLEHLKDIKHKLGDKIFYFKSDKKNNSFKISKKDYFGIVNFEETQQLKTTSSGLLSELQYNTFAQSPEYILESFNEAMLHTFTFQSYGGYGYEGPERFHIISNILLAKKALHLTQAELIPRMIDDSEEYFFSYIAKTPISEKYLDLFGFREDEIGCLLRIENEHRRKIFPRYIYISNIRTSCEEFCQNKNITILRPFSGYEPYNHKYKKGRSGTEVTLKTGCRYEKDHFMRSLAFMNMLEDNDIGISAPTNTLHALWRTKNLFEGIGIPKLLCDFDLSQYDQTKQEAEYEGMLNEVWSNFKKNLMQKVITDRTIQFVEEYQDFSRKTDWTDAFIWDLKQKYLQDFYKVLGLLHGEKNMISPKVGDLMKKAGPEIEILYNEIKAIGLSGHSAGMDEKWQNAVLTKFQQNRAEFKFIKEKYLSDKNLFAFSYSQEIRDFFGGILKKILDDHDLDPPGAETLYTIYKKIIGKKID